MRSVIVSNIMSVDGYYEGPGRNMMVLNMDSAFDAYNLERIRSADIVCSAAPRLSEVNREISRVDNLRIRPRPTISVWLEADPACRSPYRRAAAAADRPVRRQSVGA